MPRFILEGTFRMEVSAPDIEAAKVKMEEGVGELQDAGDTLLAGRPGFAEAKFSTNFEQTKAREE